VADWRLQGQEQYLKGVALARHRYKKLREDWDHDHCEFCSRKFSERPGDLNEGYVTADCYRWVCDDCYGDFKDAFGWTHFDGPCDPDRKR
jgi:hypothetical protein